MGILCKKTWMVMKKRKWADFHSIRSSTHKIMRFLGSVVQITHKKLCTPLQLEFMDLSDISSLSAHP